MTEQPGKTARDSEQRRYWRLNLVMMIVLLTIWFIAGPLLSILLADKLQSIKLGGFPLGFWFAQQGSIFVFVLIIAAYALIMNRIDRRHIARLKSAEGQPK